MYTAFVLSEQNDAESDVLHPFPTKLLKKEIRNWAQKNEVQSGKAIHSLGSMQRLLFYQSEMSEEK